MRRAEVVWDVLLALAGAATVLIGARSYGLGVGPDSLNYLDGARTLAAGQGYRELLPEGGSVPLTHFPPVLSLLLAAGARIGLDPVKGALALNSLCLGISAVLASRIVRDASGGRPWAGLFGGVALIAGVEVASVHVSVASEPPFIVFLLASLWLLADTLARGSRLAGPLAAAALAGLSAATRYIGIAVVMAGGIAIYFADVTRPRVRLLGRIFLFGVVASFPPGLFVLRNQLLSGAVANAPIYFRPISSGAFLFGLRSASCWLLPEAVPAVLRIVVLAVLVLLVGHAVFGKDERRADGGPSRRRTFAIVMCTFACCYVVVLTAARWFADASIPFYGRLLVPLEIAVTLLAVAEFVRVTSGARRNAAAAARLAGAAVLCVGLARTARFAWVTGQTGLAHSGRQWRESRVLAALRALPRDVTVYSNLPEVVAHLDDRRCARVPVAFDEKKLVENHRLESDIADWRAKFDRGASVLVFWRRSVVAARPSEGELLGDLRVRTVVEAVDGAVYSSRTPEAAR